MTERLHPDETTTLFEARSWLARRLLRGAKCPCCKQFAKVYRRQINKASASFLLRAYQAARQNYFDMKSINQARGGDSAKLRYWGLIEEDPRLREDGGRLGYWRITDAGVEFLRGHTVVPKYALVYDSRLLRHVGRLVSITDCLGSRFDLRDVMGAA